MKKILLLTPIYPATDIPKTDTPVVHYFTREWVKMGYDVRVVHYVANFPKVLYLLAKPFKEMIGAKAGFGIRTSPYQDSEYEIEGVKVKRITLRKFKPHALHPRKDIQMAFRKTVSYCRENDFTPDCIIGHWPNPQLEIMALLKKEFNCKTAYVSHGCSISKMYKERAMNLINDVDIFGFRCDVVKRKFFDEFNINKPSFMCYSGIPENFLEGVNPKDFSAIHDYIYVGTLINRKNPSKIVEALKKSYGDNDFCMRYVGSGAEEKSIQEAISKTQTEDRVHLMGRVDRSEVRRLVDASQVFVMISKNEAFGLVYLEAMARGCITIASQNEGFDGIIQHGVNGFLCEAGNADELADVITIIRKMPKDELVKISQNAIKTAESLTDINAAKYYIESVKSVIDI